LGATVADCRDSDGTTTNVYQLFVNTDSGVSAFENVGWLEGFGLTADLNDNIHSQCVAGNTTPSYQSKSIKHNGYAPDQANLILGGLYGLKYGYGAWTEGGGIGAMEPPAESALNVTFGAYMNWYEDYPPVGDEWYFFSITSSGHLLLIPLRCEVTHWRRGPVTHKDSFSGSVQVGFSTPGPDEHGSGNTISWDDGTTVEAGGEFDTGSGDDTNWNWNITQSQGVGQLAVPVNLHGQDPWNYVNQWTGSEAGGTWNFTWTQIAGANYQGYDVGPTGNDPPVLFFEDMRITTDGQNTMTVACNGGYDSGSTDQTKRTYTGTVTMSGGKTTASGTYQVSGNPGTYDWNATLSPTVDSFEH